MKRLVAILLAAFCVFGAGAQDHWRNRFVVGADFNASVGDKKEYSPGNNDEFSRFKGSDIHIAYKMYLLKGLFVMPELSLFYESHDVNEWQIVDYPLGSVTERNDEGDAEHASAFGMGISARIGYTIPVYAKSSWDLYTGPSFRYAFDQHQNWHGHHAGQSYDSFDYKKPAFRWLIGVAFNYWRLSLRAEYTFTLTDYMSRHGEGFRGLDVFSVGLAYNF